ncbi:MAG TPA: GatB/YqeY domain-containing protein, partial [Mycobacteriales bacterium]|nr:GatB/YqeY domain-containing protein [Mycobacteriales bacterium]
TGASGMPQMGAVMRLAQQKAAGRADGKRLSTEVRRQLSG